MTPEEFQAAFSSRTAAYLADRSKDIDSRPVIVKLGGSAHCEAGHALAYGLANLLARAHRAVAFEGDLDRPLLCTAMFGEESLMLDWRGWRGQGGRRLTPLPFRHGRASPRVGARPSRCWTLPLWETELHLFVHGNRRGARRPAGLPHLRRWLRWLDGSRNGKADERWEPVPGSDRPSTRAQRSRLSARLPRPPAADTEVVPLQGPGGDKLQVRAFVDGAVTPCCLSSPRRPSRGRRPGARRAGAPAAGPSSTPSRSRSSWSHCP